MVDVFRIYDFVIHMWFYHKFFPNIMLTNESDNLFSCWGRALLPTWMNKYVLSKVQDEITYSFPNFNVATRWEYNLFLYFIMDITTCWSDLIYRMSSQIAKFMGPTWGPPGSCRPQLGPMLVPWTLLSGVVSRGSSSVILDKTLPAKTYSKSWITNGHLKKICRTCQWSGTCRW